VLGGKIVRALMLAQITPLAHAYGFGIFGLRLETSIAAAIINVQITSAAIRIVRSVWS
jgi:hypothetical protein